MSQVFGNSMEDIKDVWFSRLPRAYNGCTCDCHRIEGVLHCVPCCLPKEEDTDGEKK